MALLDSSLNQIPGLSDADAVYINGLQLRGIPICPACGSRKVDNMEAIDTNGAMGSRKMCCQNCHALWLEVWQCTGYSFLERDE